MVDTIKAGDCKTSDFYRQDQGGQTLIIACPPSGSPELLYLGQALPTQLDSASLSLAQSAGVPQAMLDQPAPLSLVPENGRGWQTSAPIRLTAEDRPVWSPCWQLEQVRTETSGWSFCLLDAVAHLRLELRIHLTASGVLEQALLLTNLGTGTVAVQQLACTLPVPAHFNERLTFHGRWCQEFQQTRSDWQDDWWQENRHGRIGHAHFPGIIVGERGFTEQTGAVLGVHLAWSGNHHLSAHYSMEGHRLIHAGALYLPGEITLNPGESISTPTMMVATSDQGLNAMSQRFHKEARERLHWQKPRPIHLNTWEAFYFDHRLPDLIALAEAAADVGVERYILDDGWFRGRNHERAALGDWYVDSEKYPDGLHPLVDRVHELGMEFGLWVEPEMLNPDSDLYRTHPDWALQLPQYQSVLGRYQLVLDLSNPEAYDYIRERLFALLNEYRIDYLKWDMNRDYVQPGVEIHPSANAQVLALYRLLDDLNQAFPQVEIESCASGGARVDFGILQYTRRFWTSDCNDALERQSIQRGFSYFFPPELMGAHIGPDTSHTTSRTQALAFRAGTAIAGHLGIEWNLLSATPEQKTELRQWLALYQSCRDLLHSGKHWRLPTADGSGQSWWTVSTDGQEGLAIYSQLTMSARAQPLPLRLPGLKPDDQYRVSVQDHSPIPGHLMKTFPAWWGQDLVVHGAGLMQSGLQLPVLDPESVLIVKVESIDLSEEQ